MNPKLTMLTEMQDGVFSRADALACGYTDAQIRARVRTGRWIRLRRGVFTAAELLMRADSLAPDDQAARNHRLQTRAVLATHPGGVVASHQTAVVAHGLPCWGLDLGRVHLTRTDDRPPRSTGQVVTHTGSAGRPMVRTPSGIDAVPLARAVVEAAALSTFEAGVVVSDAALRTGDVDAGDLRAALLDLGPVAGSVLAAHVVAFADGAAESVGESRLRVLMDRVRLPPPVPQHTIHDDAGEFVARVDFFLPEYVTLIEFDGRVKYREDAVTAVVREKAREDRLRALGYEVVRVGWVDLDDPRQTALRIVRAMRRGRSRLRTLPADVVHAR
jgi:hypothetical protein